MGEGLLRLSLSVGSEEGTAVGAVVIGVLTSVCAVGAERTRPEPVNNTKLIVLLNSKRTQILDNQQG